MLACRVAEPDQWCRRCGCEGAARDSVTRWLAHEPLGWRPTVLAVTVRRYRCGGCGQCVAARHHPGGRAAGEAVPSRAAVALDGLVVQHLTVARIAEGLGVAWNTANDAVLAEGKRVYYTLDREESLWRPRAPGPQWTDPAWWPASGNLA